MRQSSLPIFVVAMLVASNAWAHPGHFASATLASGFAHPWLGLDHSLAAAAVGLWASAQQTGSRWRAPALFVTSMIVGALSGQAFGAPPIAEVGIAGSLVLLGALLLAGARLAPTLSLAAIAVFGMVHGLVHGAEAPAGAWPAYLAGLATGTMLLHGVGIAGGHVIRRQVPRLWPALAIACSVVGAWLLATT